MTRQQIPPTTALPAGGATRYRDRIFDDSRHDPYAATGKIAEPTLCEACGAVFQHGRWRWSAAPEGAHMATCPACRRMRDRMPAGTLTLEGAFFLAHRTEITRLVQHEAAHERAEHAQNRIIAIEELPERTVVTTTDIHLPQRLGRALERACHGELDVRYARDAYSVRALWRRD